MKKQVINFSLISAMIFSLGIMSSCSSDDDSITATSDDDSGTIASEDDSTTVVDDPVVDQPNEEVELVAYEYLLGLSLPSTKLYPLHTLTQIESGEAGIFDAQEIPDIPSSVPITGKGGYVYLNSTNKLTKYETDANGVLVEVGNVANTGISGGPVSTFLSDTRLLVSTGARAAVGGVFSYQIINVETMTEESSGAITLPIYESDSRASPSLFIPKDGKIYVPFYQAANDYIAYDFASVAIYDETTLAFEKEITTDKAAGVGYSVIDSHFFSESEDLYFISSNSNFWTGNEAIPSGLTRIKAGEDEFDTDYFLNLTEKVGGNHTGGMAYAGNNKVVFQVFRSDLIIEYDNYSDAYTIEYYVVDLATEEVTQLNIPLCKYPRDMIRTLEDGRVAIVANTEEGNYIYTYNAATNAVTQGLKYLGTETISSLDFFE